METISIKKTNALSAFNNADNKGKQLLTDLLGKENLLPMDITERVQNFNDILSIGGKTMADMEKPGDTPDEIAYRKAKLIAKVYNGGKELEGRNTNQKKHFPYHLVSGSGLSCDDFVRWLSNSDVGVRLCFENPNHAIDAGKKFIDIYTDLKIN